MPAKVKYKPEFAEEIIYLGQSGKTPAQIASHFGIQLRTLREWLKSPEMEEFRHAYGVAETHSQAYWEDLGMKGTKGTLAKFSPASWIFFVKNLFKDTYSDTVKTDLSIKDDIKNMSNDELDAMIAQMAINQKSSNGSGSPAQVEAD